MAHLDMGNLTDKAVYGAKAQTEGAHQKRVAKTRGKDAWQRGSKDANHSHKQGANKDLVVAHSLLTKSKVRRPVLSRNMC